MFVRLALVSGFAASLLPSVACYRINVKNMLDKKLGVPVSRAAGDSAANVTSTVLGSMPQNQTITNDTQLLSDTVMSSLLNEAAKHDEMPHFVKGTHTSKRSIGNMLASVGLMRARLVMNMASSVLPTSLAEKILPAAFLQQEPAGLPPGPSSDMSFVTKGACFLIVAVVIYLVSKGLLEVALSSKILASLAGSDEGVDPQEVRATITLVVKYAIPQIIGFSLYMVNEVVSTLSIGHAGTKEQLAAVGLCNMMMNAFLYTLGFGILGPLDSFVSTAWGAGDKELCVAFVNKSRVVGFAQALWFIPLFWFAEPILLQLGQDPAVAQNASGFCRVIAVAYIPFFVNVSINALLKNIGDPMIGVVGLLVGNGVHIAMCFTLVVRGGWGNFGIVCSWAANQSTWFLVQAVYLATKSALKDQGFVALFFVDPRMCNNLMPYLKLAVPNIFAQGCENWFWESVTMIIGTMSSTALAAHVATNNLQGVLMMGTLGLTGASATVVGSMLGAGNIGLIRVLIKLLPIMAFCIWAVIFTMLMTFRHELTRTYCDEADVRNLMASLLTIIAFAGFPNSMQAVTSGILKAMAQQRTVAYILVLNYYMVALPLSYFVGVKLEFGVQGVYMCFFTGLMLMFLTLTYRATTLDMQQESENAKARMDAGKAK